MENTQKVCIIQITISFIPLLPISFPMGYLSLERHMHLKSNFATYLKSVSEICMNCNSHTYTYTHTHTYMHNIQAYFQNFCQHFSITCLCIEFVLLTCIFHLKFYYLSNLCHMVVQIIGYFKILISYFVVNDITV